MTEKFAVDQRYRFPAGVVFEHFMEPSTYTSLPEFGRISRPEPLSVVDEGDRRILRMRFGFTADLPTAAKVVIDPEKLTWVQETTFDRTTKTSDIRFLADHYADKMEASASARYLDNGDGDGSVRSVSGRFRVKLLFGAGPVERAIADGLREHLEEEAVHVESLLEED